MVLNFLRTWAFEVEQADLDEDGGVDQEAGQRNDDQDRVLGSML
jgi:hypothetical protein